ncbi:MAG TPA: type II toxin-antitoxin system prevent-host-death family antitoxin [Steroidobacteraceae bacterium]|nr:type II toxin-antitoxin system prevent-host-death family antitoxin [Steroidobacteraceae bacterium]
MSDIGVFEAKTHLSELLDRVVAGEEFTITRRGHPVARLIAAAAHDPEARRRAIGELQAFATGRRLGEGGWKSLRDAGRRC